MPNLTLRIPARWKWLLLLPIALSMGCNLPTSVAEPTPTPKPIEAPPTPAPEATEIPAPDIAFEGVSFSFDPSLTAEVVAGVKPAEGEATDPTFMIVPEHIQFHFVGYTLPDTFHEAQIFVYPVADFEAVNEFAGDVVAQLRQFLLDQPSAAPDGIPFLPMWNAGPLMHSNIQYLDFENGSGVRFLTQYGQAMWPIDNHNLFFTFQGMTDDSEHYIAAIFPVSNPILPDDGAGLIEPDFEGFANNWENYLADILGHLNTQDASTFSPDLDLLDALIQSLRIE